MKKDSVFTIILIIIFLTGLSLLLYPTISDWWNSFHQSKAIAEYAEQVTNMDDDTYEKLLEAARKYNAALLEKVDRYEMSDSEKEEYESLLNVSGVGIMGYIEIPLIDCSLPIYHTTRESVLQIAVGHLEGTSLPVGGSGTHCAFSGHRGLPSARLFTDLDKLSEGDTFMIHVLDETLTYEVDQILTVEPFDMDPLEIDAGKDYCTLVTYTPYGVNTHRLLVRGHRVKNADEGAARVTGDALKIDPIIITPLVAAPMILALLIWVMVGGRRKKRRQ